MTATSSTAGANLREFIISRTFDAPRELVWKSFTEPERTAKWFAPQGFTSHVVKQEFKPGGLYHYYMQSPDGKKMWGRMTYREMEKPSRLVYVNAFSDEKGGLGRHPMSASWPLEMLTTVTFEAQGGKTLLTIKWEPINASAEEIATFESSHAGMTQGWGGTLDNLAAYLAKQ